MNLNLELKLEQQLQLRIAKEGLQSASRAKLEALVLQLLEANFIFRNNFASVVKGEYLENIDQAISDKKTNS
jgi:hypothetical protein